MYITPDKGLDNTFLKAGNKYPYTDQYYPEGTVHFQHHYLNDSWQYPASKLDFT